ncbi:uncharacterized protein LOC142786677 [Rhipicephalus microplus]|uniref:uncharacterized protein LOC142786677 n=1 Tax=Rhipicephalus microplus TaxID=6941 RepID=UPI003F6AE197
MALAGPAASLPTETRFPARCSVYADDVALWVRGPRGSIQAIRRSLQAALDAVITYLGGIGLKVSATKTEALLIHPLAAARTHVRRLRVGNRILPWRLLVKYLGLTIDHQLTWIPAAKAATTKLRRVQGAISRLQLRGRGCSTKWALLLNQAAASSVLLYAFPLVNLTPTRRGLLEGLHSGALRAILGLPKNSQVAATLAECPPGASPQSARITMGGLCLLYHQMVPDPPVLVTSPPPHHQPPEVHLSPPLLGRGNQATDACGRTATCGFLQAPGTTGGTAAGVHGRICDAGRDRSGRMPDLLAEDIPLEPAAVLCDSKAALQTLANSRCAGLTACLLTAKFQALTDAGVSISFHWLPSHVAITGNEKVDTLATAAHQPGTLYFCAVAARDYSQARLKRLLVTVHQDPRVASGRGPKPLPEAGLTKRERASLLRLRTGCVWTAAHRHAKGLCPSLACSRCGEPETIEALFCACPGLAQKRLRAYAAYKRQGLPVSTLEHLLFPSRPHPAAHRSMAEFVEESGIAAYC